MSNSPDRSPIDDSIDPDKEARMLLNPPGDAVQFTSNSSRDPTNGQVILTPAGSGPTGHSSIRTGVGMTKQELMKYANDPFWVGLRTFLFILFWVIWFAMLIGSVVIVAMAPGCPATASLPWWKKAAIVQLDIGDTPATNNRVSYARQLTEKLSSVESSLNKLAANNVDTLIIGPFDPFILAPSSSDDNSTKETIEELRDKLSSLAKNEREIKIIADLKLAQTPESFEHFNETESADAFIKKGNNSRLLNYASPKVRDLIKDTVLAWMKTKIEGIQTGAIHSKPKDGEVSKSKEAELDLLKAVKHHGKNKMLLITDQELSRDAFEEGEESASFDMAPESSFYDDFLAKLPKKEAFDELFDRYVKQEEKHMMDFNKTISDILVNRDTVGKHWRNYIIPNPSDSSSPSNLSLSEAATMALLMIPRMTPVVKMNINSLENDKSNIVEKMLKLRHDNPETFLAGRTILPKVSGTNSDQIVAVYRGAKGENGYLFLANLSKQDSTISIDTNELPYQDEMISKRIILVNSDSNQDSIGLDVDLGNINLQPNQSMLIEFSGK